MGAGAAFGLELPCRGRCAPDAFLLVYHGGRLVATSRPRPGRLRPPRRLKRELQDLLAAHRKATQAAAAAAGGGPVSAALRAAAEAWQARIRACYLTTHYLRVPQTDRFQCFPIPKCVQAQLARQVAGGQEAIRPSGHLSLVALLPVTPSLRLLDKLSAYLRAPGPPGSNGRPGRGATGQWLIVPAERVQARLVGRWVVVVVG